jgi:hypothetical protein
LQCGHKKCYDKQLKENFRKYLFIDVLSVELISINELDLELSILKSIKESHYRWHPYELLKYGIIAMKKWILNLYNIF